MTAGVRVIATVKAEARFGGDGLEIWRLEGLSRGLPNWFERIRDRDFNGNFDRDWFDHPAADGDALVVEPYGLGDHDLRELRAFAERYDLSVSISATSGHYPTRTLAVYIKPRQQASAA